MAINEDELHKILLQVFCRDDGLGIAEALFAVAKNVKHLGMGYPDEEEDSAAKHIGQCFKEGCEVLADAINNHADAVNGVSRQLMGIGQEIGWGLDPEDSRKNHI